MQAQAWVPALLLQLQARAADAHKRLKDLMLTAEDPSLLAGSGSGPMRALGAQPSVTSSGASSGHPAACWPEASRGLRRCTALLRDLGERLLTL